MSRLAPCSVCHRHARVHDGACPFCGGALNVEAKRAVELPPGAKRAMIFALSVSAAAPGCNAFDRDEEPETFVQPIYGAVISPTATASTPPAPTNPPDVAPTAQPTHSAPPVPSGTAPVPTASDAGSDANVDGGDSGVPDAGDAGSRDAGSESVDASDTDTVNPEPIGTEPLPVPIYGGPPSL